MSIIHIADDIKKEFEIHSDGTTSVSNRGAARLLGVDSRSIDRNCRADQMSRSYAEYLDTIGFNGADRQGERITDIELSIFAKYYAYKVEEKDRSKQAELLDLVFSAIGARTWIKTELGYNQQISQSEKIAVKQIKPKVLESLTLDQLGCIENFDIWGSTLEERMEMLPEVDPSLLYMPEQVSEHAISAAKNKEFRAMVVKKLAKIEKICAEAASECDEVLLLRIKIEAQADRRAEPQKAKRPQPWELMDEPYLIDEFYLEVDESYNFELSKEHIKAAKQFESNYQKLSIASSKQQKQISN